MPAPPTMIHERVDGANAGTNPTVICKVRSGWAVLGDVQFLPGYCLLLPDPVVGSLNDLPPDQRGQYLVDMAAIGDAILCCTDAYRVNYSILGNTEAALHAHIFARYRDEPDERRRGPAWFYYGQTDDMKPFSEGRDRPLMDALRNALIESGHAVDTTAG
ncbi:MAG: hypothetical protein AAGK09_04815 [Planctomycetota bacterium]